MLDKRDYIAMMKLLAANDRELIEVMKLVGDMQIVVKKDEIQLITPPVSSIDTGLVVMTIPKTSIWNILNESIPNILKIHPKYDVWKNQMETT